MAAAPPVRRRVRRLMRVSQLPFMAGRSHFLSGVSSHFGVKTLTPRALGDIHAGALDRSWAKGKDRCTTSRGGRMRGLLLGLMALLALPSAAAADVWEPVPKTSLGGGGAAHIQPDAFRGYTVDDRALENRLDARARAVTTTLTLPAPDGKLQRFAVVESPIMEPGLAARHPEITTYSGRGINDPAATIRADRTPLGFHASVRSPAGAWYVDP